MMCRLLVLLAILLMPAMHVHGQDESADLPKEVRALFEETSFSVEAFDKAAGAVRLAAGSLEPLAKAAREAGTPLARRILVEVLRAQAKLPDALKEAEALQELLPKDPETAELCGRLAEVCQDLEAAADWYGKALEMAPSPSLEWELRVHLCLLDFAAAREEKALAQLQQAVLADPGTHAARAARIAGLHEHVEFAAEHAGPIESTSHRHLFLSYIQTSHFQGLGGDFGSAALTLRKAGELAFSRRERRYATWAEADLAARAGKLDVLIDAWRDEESLSHDQLKFLVEALESLGRAEDSLALLDRPEAEDPAAEEWVSLIFTLVLDSGAVEEALEILREKLAREPNSLDVRLRFSRILVDLGRVPAAEALWREALLIPTWQQGRQRISLCRRIREAGFPDLARQALGAMYAGEDAPWGLWAGLELARLWNESGHSEKSLPILEAVAGQEGADRDILRATGEALEQLGFEKQAADLYSGVLAIASGEDLEMRLAWLLPRIGKGLEAIAHLESIWEKTGSASRRRQAENQLLELSAKEGVLGELADRLEVALEKGEVTQKEIALLVNLYTKVGDPDSAAEVLGEFSRQGGDRAASLQTLSRVYLDTGELREYEKVLRQLIEVDPENVAEWWMQLAMSALERSVPEEAEKALRELAALDESNHGFNGGVLAFAGLHDEAVDEYRKALAEDPDEVEIWLLVGRELAAAGRTEEALALYQFLADRPVEEDLFVVAVDGLLNLDAPQPMLAWAARRVEERIAIEPTRLYLYKILVDLLETLGRKERASWVLSEMVPVAAEQRGVVLRELLEEARSARDNKRVVRFGRQLMALGDVFPPEVYLAVGEALVKEKAFAEAARIFARARDAQDFVAIQKRVAGIYLENGKSDLALRILRRLLLQAPEDPGLLADVASAETVAGDPAAMNTWTRTLNLLLARTPKRREGPAQSRTTFRNVDAMQVVWDQVVQGLAGSPDRDGLSKLLIEFADLAGIEMKEAGDELDLDRMPRLAKLMDTIFKLALVTGQADLSRELCLELAGTGKAAGQQWISSRMTALLSAGWGRTALALLDSMGDKAPPLYKWRASWIVSGDAPTDKAPNLMEEIHRAVWHFVFSGPEAARKTLEPVLAKADPLERNRAVAILAPFWLVLGDREAFAREIIDLMGKASSASGKKTPRPVHYFQVRNLLARAWRILTLDERQEMVDALAEIAASDQEAPGWRALYLHALLASGADAWEGLDLYDLVVQAGKSNQNADELVILLVLVGPEKRHQAIEAFANELKTYSLARFLSLTPKSLGPDLDEASLDTLCRFFETCKELEQLVNNFARYSNPGMSVMKPEHELRLLDVLVKRSPSNPYLLAARAKAVARAGRMDEAAELARSLLSAGSSDPGSTYYIDDALRNIFGEGDAKAVETMLRETAMGGSSEAANALVNNLSGEGRSGEALQFLTEWTAKHGEKLKLFQRRISLLGTLGRHVEAAREAEAYYSKNTALQGHHYLNWSYQLREQGKFRQALQAISSYSQPGSAGIDYGAMQRVRYYKDLPPSEERDRLIVEDVRKFLHPEGEHGMLNLGHQFQNMPPEAMAVFRGEQNMQRPSSGLLVAATLPGVLPDLEGTLALLPSVMRGVGSSWELLAAVAWGYHAQDRDEELLERLENTFAAEPADRTAIMLANMAACWIEEARRMDWVKRGVALSMATDSQQFSNTLFWVDRLAAAGDKEAAARLAAYTILNGCLSNDYRARQMLQEMARLKLEIGVPREVMILAMQSQLPLLPNRVFGQYNPSFHDTYLLENWVRQGGGADLLEHAGDFIVEVMRLEGDPNLARIKLVIAAALADTGRKKEAQDLFERLCKEADKGNVYLSRDLAKMLLPDDPEGLEEMTAFLEKQQGSPSLRRGNSFEHLMVQIALQLDELGEQEKAQEVWQKIVALNDENDLYGLSYVALEVLEKGKADWALPILEPLVKEGRFSPSRVADTYEKLEKAGVDRAVLAQGLKYYLEEFPRKDLALLAARLLPPEEASRAIDAALEESPRDAELRAIYRDR